MYVCMHTRPLRMYVCIHLSVQDLSPAATAVRLHLEMVKRTDDYLRVVQVLPLYVCVFVCQHACMYVCTYMYVRILA